MKYEHINTLRIGNLARISPDLYSRTIEGLEDDKYVYTKDSCIIESPTYSLTELLDSLSIAELEDKSIERVLTHRGKSSDTLIKEADVVFCTLNG